VTKICSLSTVVDQPQPCPREACAYWQPAIDDIEGGCAIERLELDRHGVDIATFLLSFRHQDTGGERVTRRPLAEVVRLFDPVSGSRLGS
jgi:hypothetical protein